jgi:hypothetical protein
MATFLAEVCVSGTQIIVDEGSLLLTIGDFCSVIDGGGNNLCVTIVDDSVSLANYTAQTQYADCTVCADSEGLNVIIQDCEKAIKYIIPFSGVNTPVSLNDTYFFTLDDGRGNLIELCAFVIDLTPQPIRYYVTNKTSYLNCLGCSISANTTTFEVQECFGRTSYYVLLPVDVNTGTIISFNPINSLDQLCGEIIREEPGTPPTAIYLADFGACDDCLEQVSVRRIIESCIDGTQQVVFGSALYNINESSFLTINDPAEGFSGCYRIGNETTDPVTVTGYLGYSPSPSCEECISCNGFEFEYFVCGEPTLSASTFSRQYIEIGHSFYHPVSGCCEVSQIITANTSTDIFYSFYEYDNCEECTGSTIGYETWVATDCTDSSSIIISTPSGYNIGDYVSINTGILTTSCIQINSVYAGDPITTFAKTTELTYSDCTDCKNNTYVAYPFVNCSTSDVTYYSINLTNYELLISNGIVRDGSFNCYYAINGCATPTYPIIEGIFFTNCTECNAPLSAGTEIKVCVICCPCTSGETVTQVTVPHPQWTNAQNKTILMLDAIVLGGPNGLNA